MAAFAALTALTAIASPVGQIALWRILTGLGASDVVPLVLAGKLFPLGSVGIGLALLGYGLRDSCSGC